MNAAHENRAVKKQKWSESRPAALCTCGHHGDGMNSDHVNLGEPGQGACHECGCTKFSWKGWTLPFLRYLERNE